MTAIDPEKNGAVEALDKLAAALAKRGYETVSTPQSGPPSLAVRNPCARQLAEDVYATHGWFWWPWADRIAPVTEIAQAADKIAWVLRAATDPAND